MVCIGPYGMAIMVLSGLDMSHLLCIWKLIVKMQAATKIINLYLILCVCMCNWRCVAYTLLFNMHHCWSTALLHYVGHCKVHVLLSVGSC